MFDLLSGFFQLAIDPNTIDLTAFITLLGLDNWRRLPQGQAGSPPCVERVTQ